MACYEDLAERHLQFCAAGVETCVTEFEADWGFNGQQTFSMRRGCGSDKTENGCLQASGPNGNYHDAVF